jgi:hypothetical protein
MFFSFCCAFFGFNTGVSVRYAPILIEMGISPTVHAGGYLPKTDHGEFKRIQREVAVSSVACPRGAETFLTRLADTGGPMRI